MEWGGHERDLELVALRLGRVPAALARKPKLYADLEQAWLAFLDLSHGRQRLAVGANLMGLPITVEACEAWCRVHLVLPEARATLWSYIKALDDELLEHARSRAGATEGNRDANPEGGGGSR